MRRLVIITGILLATWVTWTADPTALGVPTQGAPGTFSAERLARLDGLLQHAVDENRIAGVVALVLRDGKPAYERVVGWSDKEANRRMTSDTVFRIASQTKAITSVAILSLVEEGQLTLTEPAGKYLPTFAKTTVAERRDAGIEIVPARRSITIRDLLTHTAGISYGTSPDIAAQYQAKGLGPAAGFGWYLADKDEPVCDTMDRLGTLPFVAQPGDQYVYGYNTDILGCIVERASGLPLDEFIRRRITAPLGMNDTRFFLPPTDTARLAAVYAVGSDGKITRAPEGARGQGAYADGPRRNFAGGAGLLSTARDYARFLEMIRNGGIVDGVRILAPRTVMLMTTNQVGTLHSTTGLGFGLGFQTTDRFGASGMEAEGGFGWSGAYQTWYRVDPDARLTMVLMLQLLPGATDLRVKFPAMVYSALQER